MIATLAAIGVLILEGCITAMFERLHNRTSAPSGAVTDIEGNGNAASMSAANIHGHEHHEHGVKGQDDKVRHLTIAQARPSAERRLVGRGLNARALFAACQASFTVVD